MKKEILINNAKEYYLGGDESLEKKRYNSAVVLFFKSLVALIDAYLLEETGNTPSSHTNRVRILEKNYEDIYDVLDKDFPHPLKILNFLGPENILFSRVPT